jgi:hypothetical protein
MEFPKFWYESNACWGNVESFDDLKQKLQSQLAENNSIYTIDDFLDKSTKSSGDQLSFGTRREHTEKYSLRDFLKDNNLLDEFLIVAQGGVYN